MIRLDALYGKVLSKRRDRGLLQSLERQWSYDSIFLKAQRPLGDTRCFVDTGIVAEVEKAERNAIWEDISSDSGSMESLPSSPTTYANASVKFTAFSASA